MTEEKKNLTRETGFYRVRFSDVGWEPAFWNGFWLAIGSAEDASDRVVEVGERI
jgi:hypothetical protein